MRQEIWAFPEKDKKLAEAMKSYLDKSIGFLVWPLEIDGKIIRLHSNSQAGETFVRAYQSKIVTFMAGWEACKNA